MFSNGSGNGSVAADARCGLPLTLHTLLQPGFPWPFKPPPPPGKHPPKQSPHLPRDLNIVC